MKYLTCCLVLACACLLAACSAVKPLSQPICALLCAEPTPAPTAIVCPGDCNGDGHTSLAEVQALRDAVLAGAPPPCPAADANHDGQLTAADVVAAVAASQSGPCKAR